MVCFTLLKISHVNMYNFTLSLTCVVGYCFHLMEVYALSVEVTEVHIYTCIHFQSMYVSIVCQSFPEYVRVCCMSVISRVCMYVSVVFQSFPEYVCVYCMPVISRVCMFLLYASFKICVFVPACYVLFVIVYIMFKVCHITLPNA